MYDYTFTALDCNDNKLGEVYFEREHLPSHLEICLEIIQRFPTATQYNLRDTTGRPMMPARMNLKHYLPIEFYNLFKQLNFFWLGTRIKFVGGDNDGEEGNIQEYHQNKFGCWLDIKKANGSSCELHSCDVKYINIIK